MQAVEITSRSFPVDAVNANRYSLIIMKRTPPIIRFSYTLLPIILLLFAGCSHVDRLVIDGAMALQMEHRVNDQLLDREYALRGNTASNIRNGGYVLEIQDMLYFIHDMHFPPDETIRYLQEMACCSVGNLTNRNEFITTLDGRMIGSFDRFILFTDERAPRSISAYDRQNNTTWHLFEEPVTGALMLDRTIYLSTEKEQVYALSLGVDLTDTLDSHARLISDRGGTIVGVADGLIYLIDEQLESIIGIDARNGETVNRIIGGPFSDVQVAGSWFYYRDGTQLMRQPLAGGAVSRASIREVQEYAVSGHWLVFTSPGGGIYASHLDGTGIAQISHDRASGLQVVDERVYYRNHFDDGELYQIDLAVGTRTALLGSMVTDGGIRFEQIIGERESLLLHRFTDTIEEIETTRTTRERYNGAISGPFLFVVLPFDGSPLQLYRHVDEQVSADEVGALVLIGHEETALGRYTDGTIAYRVDTVLTLFDPSSVEPLLTWKVPGRPPSEIKTGEGDRYGLLVSWHQKALTMMQEVYDIR